jgi:hypothetical protein
MHRDTAYPSLKQSLVLSPEAMFRPLTMTLGMLLAGWPALAVEIGDTCSDAENENYIRAITQEVVAAWKPPYKDRTISCRVLIKQDFRGEVLNVGIASCGDDPRIHKSVIDAGYSASPIPLPANKACFSRDIIIRIESRAQDYQ